MEKLLIIGAGGLGKMTMEAAQKLYECFFVDDAYNIGDKICDVTVVGKVCDLNELRNDYSYAIVAIGNNCTRKKITELLSSYNYKIPSIISDKAYVSPYSKHGTGCIVLPYACIQNGSTLMNGVVICSLVEIHHDSFVDDYSLIYSNSTLRTYSKIGKSVKVGSNVSIGNNVVVSDSEIIKDGTIL